jgi:hypothetical protein
MPFEPPEGFKKTYAEIAVLAARYRVGVLKIGAVVVMVNPRPAA